MPASFTRQLTFIEDTGTGFWFAATIFYSPGSFKGEAAMPNDVLFFGMMVAVPDAERRCFFAGSVKLRSRSLTLIDKKRRGRAWSSSAI